MFYNLFLNWFVNNSTKRTKFIQTQAQKGLCVRHDGA